MVAARIIGTGSYLGRRVVTNEEIYQKTEQFNEQQARAALSAKKYDVKQLDIEQLHYLWNQELRFNADKEKARILGKGDNLVFKIDEGNNIILAEEYNVENASNSKIYDLWAQRISGICHRHFYDGEFNSRPDFVGPAEDMALEAALRAIESAAIDKNEIEEVIFSTTTPTNTAPPAHVSLAGRLGLKCGGETINAACSGFVHGLSLANDRIKAGCYKTALVVAADHMSSKINYMHSKNAMIFGDGAGAVILKKDEQGFMISEKGTNYCSSHAKLPADGLFEMEAGSDVLRHAAEAMSGFAQKVLGKAGISSNEIKYIIPHQANSRITRQIAVNMKLPREKFCETMHYTANMSSSSSAVVLDELAKGRLKSYQMRKDKFVVKDGKALENGSLALKRGDKIIITVAGVGYDFAACIIEY